MYVKNGEFWKKQEERYREKTGKIQLMKIRENSNFPNYNRHVIR
jgi:hypothetical protein